MRVRAVGCALAAAALVVSVSACDTGPQDAQSPGAEYTRSGVAPSDASAAGMLSSPAAADCYVWLFDSDDFDQSDDNFKLTKPGRYLDLKNLPGASKDWTGEADSIKVGDSATVDIYAEKNFSGHHQVLESGTKHSDIDEPSSLQLTC